MIKKNIPNAITCGNLLCGCLAIVQAMQGNLIWAAYLVGIAAVLDFFDGFAARMLKVSSPIGKDLDSLADMVTFGVVPGVVLFQLLMRFSWDYSFEDSAASGEGWNTQLNLFYDWQSLLKYIAFLIPVFSAIRLAKFNNDTRQSESFIGLPTPANAIFICSLALIMTARPIELHLVQNASAAYEAHANSGPHPIADPGASSAAEEAISTFLWNPYVLSGIAVLFSFLLVAPLPLFALKFKNFGFADNKIRYVFLGLSALLLGLLKLLAIPVIILLYILLSIVNNIFLKKKV